MSDHPHRRASDANPFDIEKMIAQENDAKTRASLIVLNNINLSLMANTQMITEVAGKLDAHLEHYETHTRDEAKLFNRGIGAWKVMAWVLGVAQLALIAGVGYLVGDLKDIHTELRDRVVVDEKLNARVNVLEAKK